MVKVNLLLGLLNALLLLVVELLFFRLLLLIFDHWQIVSLIHLCYYNWPSKKAC